MGFWGALEETVVDGAAGAVGMAPAVGLAGATAIHGVDAGAHLLAGDTATAKREGVAAAGSAIPYLGTAMGAADLGMAVVNGVAAVNNAAGGHMPTIGEGLNEAIEGHHGGEEHH